MFHSRRKTLEISSGNLQTLPYNRNICFLGPLERLRLPPLNPCWFDSGIADIPVVEDKAEIIEESHKRVEQITKQFRNGMITDDERYNAVTAEWRAAREKLENV